MLQLQCLFRSITDLQILFVVKIMNLITKKEYQSNYDYLHQNLFAFQVVVFASFCYTCDQSKPRVEPCQWLGFIHGFVTYNKELCTLKFPLHVKSNECCYKQPKMGKWECKNINSYYKIS